MHKTLFLALIFFYHSSLLAYESEDKLKAVIIGKVAKFVKWKDRKNDNFVITIMNNPYGQLFDEIFDGKKIQKRDVELKYIDDIDKLSDTNILYIPASNSKNLNKILEKINGKNILTISDIRGFAEKKGIVQVYFSSQKIKLKINLDIAKEDDLKISSALLRVATVIRESE